MSIVIFAAHNDDHALAMGGTIAKHAKEGEKIYTFIGSYGRMSHPHFKKEVINKIRVKEAQRADRVYGGEGHVQFLGLDELSFEKDLHRKGLKKRLLKKLRELKPRRIYTPAPNDTHPDHRSIGQFVMELTKGLSVSVYGYYVYPTMKHVKAPKLHVDVSAVYNKKIEALKMFGSQITVFTYAITNNLVYVYALTRNWFQGFLHGVRFAETFYKLQ